MNPIMQNQYDLTRWAISPILKELKDEQRQAEILIQEQEWINSTRFDD